MMYIDVTRMGAVISDVPQDAPKPIDWYGGLLVFLCMIIALLYVISLEVI